MMIDIIRSLFSYDFAARALLAGTAISICAALLGVVMTLRRYTMLGDGLSHTAFGAVAAAAALGWSPYWFALIITIAVTFLILRMNLGSASGDNAVAVISTVSFAVGMMIISCNSGIDVNMNEYLFGSVLSMSKDDVLISFLLSGIVLTAFILCHRVIFSVTFDENFCRACGINTRLYIDLLSVLTAITVVMGMRILGALLMTNLLIYPAVSSMKLLRSFKSVLICSSIVSVVCFFAGIAASSVFGTPAGAGVVIANIFVFALASLMSSLKKRNR